MVKINDSYLDLDLDFESFLLLLLLDLLLDLESFLLDLLLLLDLQQGGSIGDISWSAN